MIDWIEVREITAIVVGALVFGALGAALVFGAYVLGALVASGVGYALGVLMLLVYEVAAIYAWERRQRCGR